MTQTDLCFEPAARIPAKGTQCHALLVAMQRGERLTVAQALTEYGIFALSQRCTDLRRMGWPVLSRMVKMPSGARVAEYRMER